MEVGTTGLYMEGGESFPTVDSYIRSNARQLIRDASAQLRTTIGADNLPEPEVAPNMTREDVAALLQPYGSTFGRVNEPLSAMGPDGTTRTERQRIAGPITIAIYSGGTSINQSLPRDVRGNMDELLVYMMQRLGGDTENLSDAAALVLAKRGSSLVYVPNYGLEGCSLLSDRTPARKYDPKYRSTKYWSVPVTVALLTKLSAVMRVQPVAWSGPQFGADVREKILAGIHKYTLTNGCMRGQIIRLGECWKQADLHRERADVDPAVYNAIVSETWPVFPVLSAEEDACEALTIDNVKLSKFHFNATADPGLAWMNGLDTAKRHDVLVTDVLFNNALISAVKHSYDEETMNQVAEELMKHRAVKVKPKFEVIERADYLKKTRSVCVFNSYLQMPLSVWQQWMFKAVPDSSSPMVSRRITNHRGEYYTFARSLAGFNPYGGGLASMISKCKSIAEAEQLQFVCTFYSDNTYVYSKSDHTLYSLDVSKMESTSSLHEARVGLERLIRATIQSTPGSPNDRLCQLLVYLGADLCHYNPAILGNFVTSFPGLSSGSQSTFLVNHARMAYFSRLVEVAVNRNPELLYEMTPGDKDHPIRVPGVTCSLNLTSKCSLDADSIARAAGTLDDFGAILETDLLGHDCTPVTLPDGDIRLCACLSYDRVLKAILFRKTSEVKPDKTSASNDLHNAGIIATQITTMFGLYMSGAYAYADLSYIVTMCAAEAVMQFTMILDRMAEEDDTMAFYDTIHSSVRANLTDETDMYTSRVSEAALSLLLLITPRTEKVAAIYRDRLQERLEAAARDKTVLLPQGISWVDFFDRSYVIRRFHLADSLSRATPLSEMRGEAKLVSLGADEDSYQRAVSRVIEARENMRSGRTSRFVSRKTPRSE